MLNISQFMQFEKGLVSIIVPTHNRGEVICETLNSILTQKYGDIEIILVDDHSDEDSKTIIQSYITKIEGKNIKYVQNDGYGGNAARNTGIRKSRGEFIQFFDDDDIMLPEHISNKVNVFRDPQIDFVTCDYVFFDSTTGVQCGEKHISDIPHNGAAHMLGKALPTPCFMCRRYVIERIGEWNERINKLQDFSYFHRLFLFDFKGEFLKDTLFKVRTNSISLTSTQLKTKVGYANTMDALKAVYGEWKKVEKKKYQTVKLPLIFLMVTVGRNLITDGFYYTGMKVLFKIFLCHPFDFIKLLTLALKYKSFHLTNVLIEHSI